MNFPRRRSLALLLCGALALLCVPVVGRAETSGPLLVVEGSGAGERAFTRADLDAFPQIEVATTTPWTAGAHVFSGPSLRAVLAEAGVTQGDIKLSAVNDYFVTMNLDDATADYPIVASRIDGEPFPIRKNGPLWLIYPFDSDSKFRTELIYSRSIWQLVRISVIQP